ncbi:MAG: hypothetical protein ACI82S_000477 [Patiriisocius sp.]|jgi:hypothetical protein
MHKLARKPPLKIITVAILATCLYLLNASQAVSMINAQIYKTVHDDGTITYSDLPSPGAVEIELSAPTSTFQSGMSAIKPKPQIAQKQNIAYAIKILGPQPEATIRNNLGEIAIGAAIEPRVGGFFQLHINDQVHESATGMFKLNNMQRGAYKYSVKFINNTGKVIASSESRNVFLHQASALIN